MQTADSYLDSIAAENEAKCGRCGHSREDHERGFCTCGHQHIWDHSRYQAIDTELCFTEPDDRCELPHPFKDSNEERCPVGDGVFEGE